ncbi:MAG TPA: sarcosine oxidase subunit delta [Alphaproteobacteria bacterium]|jgi:sarcosine oxidase, subunit delta
MHLIPCPWCGPREETEFACGGEAHIARPAKPEATSDAQWADYLYMRANPKGLHRERWLHRFGCRRWFNVARDTVSHEIVAVYKMDEPPPEVAK